MSTDRELRVAIQVVTVAGMSKSQTTDERFGQVVRDRREEMGLKQSEVSEALREAGHPVSTTALAKVETGVRAVKVAEAVALARILSLHLDLLSLAGEADDLAGMLARAQAEAGSTARAEERARDEAERAAQRAEALEILSRARTEKVRWTGAKEVLLERAFGLDPEAARAGLRGLGLSDEVLTGLEAEAREGGRTNWRRLYALLRLSRLLPNLQIVKGG